MNDTQNKKQQEAQLDSYR